MPTGLRLRNVPVQGLPAPIQSRWLQQTLARRYARDIIRRAAIRDMRRVTRQLLTLIYVVVGDNIAEEDAAEEDDYQMMLAIRRGTTDSLRRFAAELPGRRVMRGPIISEEDRGLAAAVLSDRRRRQMNMTVLRTMSGAETTLRVAESASLHDFYQQAREVLGLQANISLALLRTGAGSFDQRLLCCCRQINAFRCVRGTVFEVVLHP